MIRRSTVLILLLLLQQTPGRDLHGNVQSAFSQRFFIVLEQLCYDESVKTPDGMRAEYRQILLMNSFFYWLSVRAGILPENRHISQIVQRTVERADADGWEALLAEGAQLTESEPHERHAGMNWYDYKKWSVDAEAFRAAGGTTDGP